MNVKENITSNDMVANQKIIIKRVFLMIIFLVFTLNFFRYYFFFKQPDFSTTDVALAMNRYMYHSVFPFIIRHVELLSNAQHNNRQLVDSLVQTMFKMSRARALTKAQLEMTSDCLIAVCRLNVF